MIVYVVEMLRWGDSESHSYVSGVYSNLIKALEAGIEHANFRGNKYEPAICMISIDEAKTFNNLCRNLEEAKELYQSTTGNPWKETSGETTTTNAATF